MVQYRCTVCESPNYYLLSSPTVVTPCRECKDNMICKGGANVFPDEGYYRDSNTTSQLHACYLKEACL